MAKEKFDRSKPHINIERGIVKVGEAMEIVGFRDTRQTVVTGVELLRGVEKDEVERGR